MNINWLVLTPVVLVDNKPKILARLSCRFTFSGALFVNSELVELQLGDRYLYNP